MKFKWCYLLTFTEAASSHECMKRFLDSSDDILNWHTPMSRSFFVVTTKAASGLTTLIRKYTKDKGNFIVVDMNTDYGGWLSKASWEYVKENKEMDQVTEA